MSSVTSVWVALGSNRGDRARHLRFAVRELARTPGVRVRATSPVYETEPVGGPPQGPFLNAVVELAVDPSRCGLRELLERCLALEAAAGRERTAERNAPRELDLDLLVADGVALDEPGLTLPHPRLHERAFVLAPLCDLAPALRHPVLGARMDELLARLDGAAGVRHTDEEIAP